MVLYYKVIIIVYLKKNYCVNKKYEHFGTKLLERQKMMIGKIYKVDTLKGLTLSNFPLIGQLRFMDFPQKFVWAKLH